MMGGPMTEESAKALGAMRADLVSKATAWPPPKRRHVYRYWRNASGDEEHVQVEARFAHGAAYVIDGNKDCGYHVIDRCGLALAYDMQRLRDAKTFARACGAKLDAYFARAANGDRFAASAIARLSRIHSTRARRR